jgi:hypothetical protein
MKEFFYKHEYNTIEEISASIRGRSVFENLQIPLKETPTDVGTDICSAEPNLPEYDVESVAKYRLLFVELLERHCLSEQSARPKAIEDEYYSCHRRSK